MNGNSAELLAHYLALTRMDSSPDLEVQALNRFGDGLTATGCARWPVEGREKAIACSVDLAATIPLKLLTHYEVVLTKKLLPCSITHLCRSLCCADDVGEEHCGEHAVRLRPDANTCQGGLDVIAERVDVAYPRQVIIASKLHVLGP